MTYGSLVVDVAKGTTSRVVAFYVLAPGRRVRSTPDVGTHVLLDSGVIVRRDRVVQRIK